MTHATWPRQPREGCASNLAQVVEHTDPAYFGVECQRCNGNWFEVAQFARVRPASLMAEALNEVFARRGADLDFIHPTCMPNGDYAVIWPTITWSRRHRYWTRIGGCPAGERHRTFERLYKASRIHVIRRVKQRDIDWYGLPPWRIAFLWANNIRFAVNGWNCTVDVRPPLERPIRNGKVVALVQATDWDFAPVRPRATRYGYGECLPSFATSNGEIFHTLDLVVAVPRKGVGTRRWTRNQWVKVTYPPTGRSVRARLTDVCGCDLLDLSRGVADYLRFSGGRVIVSRPQEAPA